jgi:hypothetical protein
MNSGLTTILLDEMLDSCTAGTVKVSGDNHDCFDLFIDDTGISLDMTSMTVSNKETGEVRRIIFADSEMIVFASFDEGGD